ncbi:MAG: Na+/H+ antiporter NhaA [Alphaproteobacteria bacterium]|nr:Na+/H+ antiporter NhaA [Alphaproteobacteria bacterium]
MSNNQARPPLQAMIATLQEFLRLQAAGGIVLLAAAIVAIVWANSPLAPAYLAFLHMSLPVPRAHLPLEWWINDGLMVIFFLQVGLEIKREMLEGELASWRRAALPLIAAAAGMAAPAAIYAAINWDAPATLRGWAIPSATDIAFAVGVLAVVGSRVPLSLKVFLLALAIIDDLGAILIIALFYAGELSLPSLVLAAGCMALLALFNIYNVTRLWPFLLVGVILWLAVLNSGIHATIAGVLLAMAIPLGVPDRVADTPEERRDSPMLALTHALHPWNAFFIVPLFGFANAGVSLAGLSLAGLLAPIPLGIAAGLFFGKQVGVLASVWLAVKLRVAEHPAGATWTQVYGVAVLCGIGFTMSLFIGLLAFPGDPALTNQVRLGVLTGSLLSAVVGYAVLRLAPAATTPGVAPAPGVRGWDVRS